MKKLFLHIGLGKTGSSALQSWLSLNSGALSKQGVDYADLVPHAKTGEVSSGNGYDLQRALVSQDFDEVERLLTSTYFFSPENDVALISCELFQNIRAPFVQKIHDICAKIDIDVTIIVYIRSVYEREYSTYLQGIKRSSVAHRFGEMGSDIGFLKSVEHLRRYVRVFGDRVLAVNYDVAKRDIYASIADIVGIDIQGLEKLQKKKVNRSLTLAEAEVLRRMNGLHNGVFATAISDYVINLSPNIETPVFYDQALLQRVRDVTEEDLLWVNQQFKMTTPVASDCHDGHSRTESIHLDREAYKPVIQWAMAFMPDSSQRGAFATFLQCLAVFMEDISADDVVSLKNALHRIQLEIEQVRELEVLEGVVEEAHNSPVAASAENSQMPRHIITYFYDAQAVSVEGNTQIDIQFNDWLALLAKHTVGSAMNTVANTTLVQGDEVSTVSQESAMSGYTLIRTEDMEAVLSLAAKCPLLAVGGVIEVSRTVSFLDAK